MNRNIDLFRPETWSPAFGPMWRDLFSAQRTLDKYADNVSRTLPSDWKNYGFVPACDVEEKENHYLFSMDLPGMSRTDLKIEVDEDQLIISGERKYERKEESKTRVLEERCTGTFRRTFSLPSNIDAAKVEADYKDGVLHIAVPLAALAKATPIRIGEGKTGLVGKLFQHKEEPTSRQVKVA